jgi:hypothetical protein
MVAVNELPANALTEVELICASKFSALTLGMSSIHDEREFTHVVDDMYEPWNLGYDGSISQENDKDIVTHASMKNILIHTMIRSCGSSCLSTMFVAASTDGSSSDECLTRICPSFDTELLLLDMIHSTLLLLENNVGLTVKHVLHVRLFYIDADGDDGAFIRSIFQSALSRNWSSHSSCRPAFTVVPVQAINISSACCKNDERDIFLAMQLVVMDLVHLSTELWIHTNR